MIAPSTRLLLVAALVAAPLATLAGLLPALAPACVAAIAVLAGAAAWDAGRGLRAIDALSVRLPALLRATRGLEARLPVEMINRGETAARYRWPCGCRRIWSRSAWPNPFPPCPAPLGSPGR